MGNTPSFKKEFGLIVIGGFIFTASFLWKDLIKDIEEMYFPKSHGMIYRIIFTIIVTAIIVLSAIHLKGLFGLTPNTTSTLTSTIPTGLSQIYSESAVQFDDSPIDNTSSDGDN